MLNKIPMKMKIHNNEKLREKYKKRETKKKQTRDNKRIARLFFHIFAKPKETIKKNALFSLLICFEHPLTKENSLY